MSTRLSPMASYYVRRLVQSHKDLLVQEIQDPVLLETILLEPETLLTRQALQDLEYQQRISTLEVLARAYQSFSKDGLHQGESRELEQQIFVALGLPSLAAKTPEVASTDGDVAIALSVQEVLASLQSLLQTASSYLGPKIASEYWAASQPEIEWLKSFRLEDKYQLAWYGAQDEKISGQALEDLKLWVKAFLGRCSLIISSFENMLNKDKVKHLI